MNFLFIGLLVFVIILFVIGVALIVCAPFVAEPKQFETFYGKRINILANFRFLACRFYKDERTWVCRAIRLVWLSLALSFVILMLLSEFGSH